eukprot:1140950-Pelagomonas_calceolata.AAC.2
MKTGHTPTGWNWSKLHTNHAPRYVYPPDCNPVNGGHARNTLSHPNSRTYGNPLFDAQDMEIENALPRSQDRPSPNSQPHTEAHMCQDRPTRKRDISYVEAPQIQAHGIDPTQPLSTPLTQALPPEPTQAPQTGGRRPRGGRDPTTYLDYHTQPIITSCPLPPNTLDTDVAQWLWSYKQNKAAEFNTEQASNAIFRYDHIIKKILGWQHLQKSKRSSQEKQQTQYKVQWHPVAIEEWALPIFQNDGLKVASSKHIHRRLAGDPCCQLCWSPVSKKHTRESQC